MTRAPVSLEIYVHLVDGSVMRFAQEDPHVAQRILGAIHPERLFSQRQLVIAGDYSVTAYPAAAVARVDLVGDGIPRWQFDEEVTSVDEITEDEFKQRYRAYGQDTRRIEQILTPGEPTVTFQEIELVNGERIFSEIHTETITHTMIDRGLLIHRFLSAPLLGCWRRGGGVILINPEKLARITFYPGPPETPPDAWPAHHIQG